MWQTNALIYFNDLEKHVHTDQTQNQKNERTNKFRKERNKTQITA